MSSILYYSNFCPNSKELLKSLANSTVKDEIHFICIDQRKKLPDGSMAVVLKNNQELPLPPMITKVPALMLINRGNKVLFGDEINDFLQPRQVELNSVATSNNEEPLSFSFMGDSAQGFGVASDSYSFLDQNPEEMSAKGEGGMRQQWHYASIQQEDNIETPPDTYVPDKVGTDSYKQYEATRNASTPQNHGANLS